ncbi:MAG: OmpA family protein [Spirochaetales bacterium]|jgi:outer membrane protein OmpA-like peptidoglycan-associated protein|nr:OmpA family protein [Spirochaetales bacterium]
MCRKLFRVCLVCGIFFTAFSAEAQSLLPHAEAPEVYRVIEKYDFRRRVNGKYQGAAYREIRGTMRRAGTPARAGALPYAGRFFILEETKRAARLAAGRVDESFAVNLNLNPLGAVLAGNPGRFPTMRDFPALPRENVSPGSGWQAHAERILDPEFSGAITPVQVYVDYQYTGPGEYYGFPGHNLTAKYAVRYRRGQAGTPGDPNLEEVTGTHDVNIFLPSGEGPRIISETFREQYRYRDGREVSLEGTGFTLFEGIVPLDRPQTVNRIAELLKGTEPSLTTVTAQPQSPSASADTNTGPGTSAAAGSLPKTPVIASAPPSTPPAPAPRTQVNPSGQPPAAAPRTPANPSGQPSASPPPSVAERPLPSAIPASPELPFTPADLPDIEVQSRPEGVALTINNLNFKPDSAQLLPSETSRLEALAKTLLSIPDRTFLVVGHSANLGRPAGEKQLSIERAQAVADALEKRGVSKDRLIYEGRGSSQPVASNTNEEGRARNRRVEIIILE